jgi:hypothetical protein
LANPAAGFVSYVVDEGFGGILFCPGIVVNCGWLVDVGGKAGGRGHTPWCELRVSDQVVAAEKLLVLCCEVGNYSIEPIEWLKTPSSGSTTNHCSTPHTSLFVL